MADFTSLKVGQLAPEVFSGTDLIPHEVGGILKRGNLTDLATFIGGIIGGGSGVGFRAVQVNDGDTLPTTDKQEFILVGKGTFYNVGGGATIVTTEELNAIVSNGVFWFIGVEIPIDAPDITTDNLKTNPIDLISLPQTITLPTNANPSLVTVNSIPFDNWTSTGNLVTISYALTGVGYEDKVIIYYTL